jgi:hypothetical protein
LPDAVAKIIVSKRSRVKAEFCVALKIHLVGDSATERTGRCLNELRLEPSQNTLSPRNLSSVFSGANCSVWEFTFSSKKLGFA